MLAGAFGRETGLTQHGEHLFDEIKRYVGFSETDEALLRGLRERVLPHVRPIIDDFYDHILGHSGARSAITGGMPQVERLKGTLRGWMDGLFTGPWDYEYYDLRARIGRRHVQIDLPQQYMFTAVNVIRGHLTDVILDTAPDLQQARIELHAVDKLLDMELAIMLHTYREDYLLRMQQSERLATFGQLVASIGHELRNPLGVIESSLFLLRGRVGAGDERVTRHFDKIEGQVRVSNRIISDMLDIVRDRPVVRQNVAPAALVESAREVVPPRDGIRLSVEIGEDLPAVAVDPDQLRQVFVNLLANAYDAAGTGGEVRVTGRLLKDEVELLVSDSGPGIDPAIRTRLFEPLVTTKSKGIGLGLPLCKRIVDRNGGTIRVTAGPLPGAAFSVRLPLVPGWEG